MALIKCGGCDAIHESTQPVCPYPMVPVLEAIVGSRNGNLPSTLLALPAASPTVPVAVDVTVAVRCDSAIWELTVAASRRSRDGQLGREILRIASISRSSERRADRRCRRQSRRRNRSGQQSRSRVVPALASGRPHTSLPGSENADRQMRSPGQPLLAGEALK